MAVITKGGAPVLGLDIGAAFIKAVELRTGKGALAITGIGVLPTPPGCIVNDEIVDPVVLASAVKQVLAENGIKTKNVIASVAGQSSVVVRVIEVPKMTEKELAETMRWEIDRHIPFSADEVVKDFRPLHRASDDPHSPNMAVLLAVAQNGVVAGMLQTILAAGLTPIAIDVESLAGARAMLDVDDAYAAQTVALVNIGSTKTDVGIYESGSLAFPRTIPVAGNAMTEAVARTMNIDAADAERLKKQHGFVPADASQRFGSQSAAATEDHFDFGDFGSGDTDFAAPNPTFGAPGESAFAPAAEEMPTFGGAFGDTIEGPVFDVPPTATVDPPAFGEPGYTSSAFGDQTLGASAFSTADSPVFGVPSDEPAFAAPAANDFGTFGGDFGTPTAGLPSEHSDTPPVTSPAEPVALTPDDAPLRPAGVPDVVSEGERHRREISDAFMPVVAELAGEIKRSIEYYSTRANNARVDRVILFGGVSNMPGLNGFLESELGVPVQNAGLPRAVSLASNAVPSEYLQQVAALLPVAVGLAARDSILSEPVPNGKAA